MCEAQKDHGVYFALGSDGFLHTLGDHGDMEAAEESALDLGLTTVWLFDEETARSWVEYLEDRLPESRVDAGVALGDGDYRLIDAAAWFTVKGFSVRIASTDEGLAVDVYALGREGDAPLGGTWVLDSEVTEVHHV